MEIFYLQWNERLGANFGLQGGLTTFGVSGAQRGRTLADWYRAPVCKSVYGGGLGTWARGAGEAPFAAGWDGLFKLSSFGKDLLALDFFAGGGAVEGLDFAGGELAEAARGDVEGEGAVADAADLFDVVADLFEHLAELSVAAFGEGDFVPGVFAAANLLDLGWLGEDAVAAAGGAGIGEAAAVDHDALTELVDGGVGGGAGDFDEIGFEDAGGSLGELVGEVSVVGHEEEAFGEVVEAADGV